MTFSEWDEAFTHQDPQKEEEVLPEPSRNDANVLLLLELAKQIEVCLKNLEGEYGIRAAELAEIPFNQVIHHLLDMCNVTSLIQANTLEVVKL